MTPTPVAQAAAEVANAPKPEQQIAYPVGFVNTVASYLAKRPFEEVVGLIQGLQQLGTPVDLQKSAPAPMAVDPV